MKKYLLVALFLMPSVSSAATLTHDQVLSILSLLTAFNVPQATVNTVEAILKPPAPPITPPAFSATLDDARYTIGDDGKVEALFLVTPSDTAYVKLNLYENGSLVGTYYPPIQYESEQVKITVPGVDPCQSYTYSLSIEHGNSVVTKSAQLPPEVCIKQ